MSPHDEAQVQDATREVRRTGRRGTRAVQSRRRVRRGAATSDRGGEVRLCERQTHRSDPERQTGVSERSVVFGTKPKKTTR